MENKQVHRLMITKKALLAAAALLAVGAPVALGLVRAPSAQAQTSLPSAKQVATTQESGPDKVRFALFHTPGDKGRTLAVVMVADTCDNVRGNPFPCHGNIALSMPSGIITADASNYDDKTQELTLTGNVAMLVGTVKLNSNRLTLDAHTGIVHVNGQDVSSGWTPPPGRYGIRR